MRDLREYAVVMVPGHGSWLDQWMDAQQAGPGGASAPGAPAGAGVRFYALTPGDIPGGSARWLGQAALMLRRFDACLLPVEPATLSWARTALAGARDQLTTPMLALVRKLRPAGLLDLTGLGIADYLQAPLDTDELRVRTEMVLARARQRSHRLSGLAEAGQAEDNLAWRYDVARDAFHEPERFAALDDIDAAASGRAPSAYAFDAAAVRLMREQAALLREPAQPLPPSEPAARAHAHAKVPPSGVSAWEDTERLIDTPFGRAKAEMVGRFERAYLHRCLMRHGGNVTQAARASAKHRRAFWALMRKHHIRAAPYRAVEAGVAEGTAMAAPLR